MFRYPYKSLYLYLILVMIGLLLFPPLCVVVFWFGDERGELADGDGDGSGGEEV